MTRVGTPSPQADLGQYILAQVAVRKIFVGSRTACKGARPSSGIIMVKAQKGAVAIIDDDPAVLDSLKFLLEVTGHSVATYGSAMEFLEDSLAQAACLILDQHMPQMTGLELTAWLRAKGVHIPVLLITGQLSPAVSDRAARLGVEKVLEKPLDDIELLRFVAAHPLTDGQ